MPRGWGYSPDYTIPLLERTGPPNGLVGLATHCCCCRRRGALRAQHPANRTKAHINHIRYTSAQAANSMPVTVRNLELIEPLFSGVLSEAMFS